MNGRLQCMAAGWLIGAICGLFPVRAAAYGDYTYCTVDATPSACWPNKWSWQLWWRKGSSGNYELLHAWGGDWAFTQTTPIPSGQSYSFILILYGPDGKDYGDWTKTATYNRPATFEPKIPPPHNVQASDGDSTYSIKVTWDSVEPWPMYQVWWSKSPNTNTATLLTRTWTNRYETPWNLSLQQGQTYYFWIKGAACIDDYDDTTEFSSPDSGYCGTLVQPPSPPGHVSASDGTYTDHVSVSWDAATHATGYQVWRGTTASTNAAVLVAGISGRTNYDDRAVSPGVSYYYWLKSTNAAFTSAFGPCDIGFARALRLTGFGMAATGETTRVTVTGTGEPGKRYALFWTPDLTEGWKGEQQTGGTSEPAAADGTFSIADVTEEGAGFYRAKEQGTRETGP